MGAFSCLAERVGWFGSSMSLIPARCALRGPPAAVQIRSRRICRTRRLRPQHPLRQTQKTPLAGRFRVWRRGWDSNPRYGRPVNRISSPAHSTTLPPLQNFSRTAGNTVRRIVRPLPGAHPCALRAPGPACGCPNSFPTNLSTTLPPLQNFSRTAGNTVRRIVRPLPAIDERSGPHPSAWRAEHDTGCTGYCASFDACQRIRYSGAGADTEPVPPAHRDFHHALGHALGTSLPSAT